MSRSLFTGPAGDHRRYCVTVLDEPDGGATVGGEGLVYRARRVTDGEPRWFALKMLTTLPLDSFEAVAARSAPLVAVSHPNLMRQVEVFLGTALIDDPDPAEEEFDVIYTVAEWVDGTPLSAHLPEPIACRLGWVAQIARGLDHLHGFRSELVSEGIVHRDVKPSNVLIRSDGTAVLLDFGIARPLDGDDLTRGAGTFSWRAPEVLTGLERPGPASDVWGVGALAYWVLTGEPPRLEGRLAARERLVPAAREAGAGDFNGVADHVSRLLESAPGDRPADLARWARELDVIIGRRRRPMRRRRSVRVGAAVLATGAVVALAVPVVVDALSDDRDVLVPAGAVWRYLDDGTDQGTAWREVDFDDSGWQRGPSPLGYDLGDNKDDQPLATQVGYGPDKGNKFPTTYFRLTFDAADSYRSLILRLRRDDGAVVYLNGEQLVRSNISAEPSYLDLAPNRVQGTADERSYQEFDVSSEATALRDGRNVLAVEIHQSNGLSDDIAFDLSLEGIHPS